MQLISFFSEWVADFGQVSVQCQYNPCLFFGDCSQFIRFLGNLFRVVKG
ncbi:hypothetical protein ADIS_4070 [Lunatimonas lonarensis]|uniref:Uncharacterized protein n=1 Tax=Lunatimonas lonarensis TaxID=1232681 RepID=R7ZMN9_9BACT|nr:hypothetical protein ADIS_4070 [Lunatimonas lonarensis]